MVPLQAAALIARLIVTQQRGRDEIPPDVPPHLIGATWRFVCECGTTWRAVADAVVRDGRVVRPERRCVNCRTMVAGRREE
jgi:hypothetical protein